MSFFYVINVVLSNIAISLTLRCQQRINAIAGANACQPKINRLFNVVKQIVGCCIHRDGMSGPQTAVYQIA